MRKEKRAHPNVAAWSSPLDRASMWVSVMTLGEIRFGVERAATRDRPQADALLRWYERLLVQFDGRVIAVDRDVVETWATMTSRRTMPVVDGLIAATARVHGLTLVTRNVRDFESAGVATLDPWGIGGPSSNPRL